MTHYLYTTNTNVWRFETGWVNIGGNITFNEAFKYEPWVFIAVVDSDEKVWSHTLVSISKTGAHATCKYLNGSSWYENYDYAYYIAFGVKA